MTTDPRRTGLATVSVVCTGGRDPDGRNRHRRKTLAVYTAGDDGGPRFGLVANIAVGVPGGVRFLPVEEWAGVRWWDGTTPDEEGAGTGSALVCPSHHEGGCGRNLTLTRARLFDLITKAIDHGVREVDISRLQ